MNLRIRNSRQGRASCTVFMSNVSGWKQGKPVRKLERLCNSVEAEGEIIKENRSIKNRVYQSRVNNLLFKKVINTFNVLKYY